MIPVIFKIPLPFGLALPINSFGLLMVLCFLAAWRLLAICLEEAGENIDFAERLVFWAAVGGVIGGRVFYLLSFPADVMRAPLAAIFSSAGFVFYGGFFGGVLASVILVKREKRPFMRYADLAAPALALGYAVGRIGCQLSGDGDYGRPSTLPWAVGYPLGVVPTPPGVTVHPTPVYETLAALLIAWLLLKVLRQSRLPGAGRTFGLYLVLSSLSRFFVEFVRVEPIVFSGFTQAQLESSVLLLIGLWLMMKRRLARPSAAVRAD